MNAEPNSCELYQTMTEFWDNFKTKGNRDLSDFESWAMREAWAKMFGYESPYYWMDGEIHCDDNGERLELCLTFNGILVLKVWNTEGNNNEQTEQYVIDIDC